MRAADGSEKVIETRVAGLPPGSRPVDPLADVELHVAEADGHHRSESTGFEVCLSFASVGARRERIIRKLVGGKPTADSCHRPGPPSSRRVPEWDSSANQ